MALTTTTGLPGPVDDEIAVTDGVIDLLSRPDEHLLELVGLVAEVCGAQAAGVTVRRGGVLHVLASVGLPSFTTDARETFCRHAMETEHVFTVPDALADERFRHIGWVDGRQSNVRFYASAPVHDPEGRPIGRLCVLSWEPQVLSALQERTLAMLAENVSQLLALRMPAASVVPRLAAELSHDLRVPLTSIVASTEMLAEELAGHPDRAVGALLGTAMRAADRMGRMLEQHMAAGVGEHAPERVEVDLGRVTRQLVDDSRSLLEAAGAEVFIGPLPIVQADPDQLYSVLQNLLTNAVKFARPDATPRVRVHARRVPQGWRVCVSDNGIGIPVERRSEVFTLFHRLDEHVEGHGIGLSTVARLVAGHDGRVGVDASAEGGAEVWFELPSLTVV